MIAQIARGGEDTPIASEAWLSRMSERMTPGVALSLEAGARVQEFDHASWSADEVSPCQDHIVAYRLDGIVSASRKISGHWHSVTSTRSSITVVPACHATSWRLDGEGKLLHIYLPPELLRQAAGDQLSAGAEYAVLERFGVHDVRLTELVDRLALEINTQEIGFTLYTESIVAQMAVSILRDHSHGRTQPSHRYSFDKRVERRLVEYIYSKRGDKLTLAELAALAELGTSQFHKHFKAKFGIPPYQYVIRARVDLAKQLLAEDNLSLAEIALEAGFADQAHLTRIFRRFCGTTPQAYRTTVQSN